MSDINLKLLQSFLLVAEFGSFRRAAEAARRSTAAISMQIKELEDQVGMRLFVRQSKTVSMTPNGRLLYEKTARAMRDINDGFQSLADVATMRQSTVTIACAATLAPKRVGGVLTTFRRRFPDSSVRLIEAPPAAALEILQRQVAEFYVGPSVSNLKTFTFEKLTDEPLLACIPPEFDQGQHVISFEDLGDAPIILLDRSTAIRTLIDDILRGKDLTLNVAYELQNAFTALSFASAGLGIAMLPSIAIEMAGFKGFRVIPFKEPEAARAIGIIAEKGYVQHNYSEQLMRLIRAAFAAPPAI
ncbi:DNA-binding transcriptional LysR family regulator [Yoonia maricola]|uniref:DNA-binding transcriptional LysR family regulator n=1 Tax=Yoonia maricola TaxID=420999 RepID=A0A2M8WP28_9RHOB|nr:LysR substrate-binding domain-containing protein [Yoonia maricola]PJI92689.1 DNA-binding transcriptional LysR family regulator [Yoonia maricola]